VPRVAMAKIVDGDQTLDEVIVIATHFGVSAIVVVYRLKTLQLISDACVATLQLEIEAGAHERALERLQLQPLDDRLGTLEELPYLSPRLEGTHLGAALPRSGGARRLNRRRGRPRPRLEPPVRAPSSGVALPAPRVGRMTEAAARGVAPEQPLLVDVAAGCDRRRAVRGDATVRVDAGGDDPGALSAYVGQRVAMTLGRVTAARHGESGRERPATRVTELDSLARCHRVSHASGPPRVAGLELRAGTSRLRH